MNKNFASRIVIDNYRVMLQIVESLTDDCRCIIYDRNMFIVQVTYGQVKVHLWQKVLTTLTVKLLMK
jgi:hypothetical protein